MSSIGVPEELAKAASEVAPRITAILSENADLCAFLLRNQACPRCCLRFVACRGPELYAMDAYEPKSLARQLDGANSPADETGNGQERMEEPEGKSGTCCHLCLGVLQHNGQMAAVAGEGAEVALHSIPGCEWDGVAHPEGGTWHEMKGLHGRQMPLLDCVTSCIREEGHEFKEFMLEVLIPAASVLRDQAMLTALKAEGVTIPAGAPVPLKEAVHLHLINGLQAATGASHVAGSGMQVTLALHHQGTANEVEPLLPESAPPRVGRGTKRRLGAADSAAEAAARAGHHSLLSSCSRRALEDAMVEVETARLQELCGIPPRAPTGGTGLAGAALRCARKAEGGAGGGALLLAGRYRKLRRNISQSPWLIDGKQKGSGSVQEVIEEFAMPRLRADSCKLVTAGREDIDVRMLGRGRPFILEVFNPRAEPPPLEEWAEMACRLKEQSLGVEIVSPQCVGREVYSRMKEGESEKEKTYSALIWIARPFTDDDVAKINAIKDLPIQQATPVRVLHRRAALTRERHILYMILRPVQSSPNYAVLELKTSAGTYIKEFVHGDFGRTQPNIGSLLGCSATITQLDVMDVHLDFL